MSAAVERRNGFVQHIKQTIAGLTDPPTERDDIPPPPEPRVWNAGVPPRPDGQPDLNALRDRVMVACRERDRAKMKAEQALEVFEQYRELAALAMQEFDTAVIAVRRAHPIDEEPTE